MVSRRNNCSVAGTIVRFAHCPGVGTNRGVSLDAPMVLDLACGTTNLFAATTAAPATTARTKTIESVRLFKSAPICMLQTCTWTYPNPIPQCTKTGGPAILVRLLTSILPFGHRRNTMQMLAY